MRDLDLCVVSVPAELEHAVASQRTVPFGVSVGLHVHARVSRWFAVLDVEGLRPRGLRRRSRFGDEADRVGLIVVGKVCTEARNCDICGANLLWSRLR